MTSRDSWTPYSLGELIDIAHGFAFKGEYFRDEPPGDILLTPGNFAIGGGFSTNKYKYYDGPVPEEYVLQDGDLIVTMTDLSKFGDTLGYAAIVPETPFGSRFLHNQRLGKVSILKGAPIDKIYLHYLLRSSDYRHEILASATGSSVRHTSPSRIKAFRFYLPPLEEQRAIAAILGSVDNKIELNRRMNSTLEEIARAIFKSWFIDFDPVHAKARGEQPYGMDLHTAALFPDAFEESESGWIPAGWRTTVLDEVLTVLETGDRPKGGVSGITEGVPSIGATNIVGLGQFNYGQVSYVPYEYYSRLKKGLIEDRDVLLYKDGGRPGIFIPHVSMFGDEFPFKEMCINSHVYRLRANDSLSQEYLFFWMSSDMIMEQMHLQGGGAAIPGINATTVRSLPVLIPSQEVLSVFTGPIQPLIAKIFANCNEARTLAELRDTLLPKLVSGEIRVGEIAHG